MEKNISTKIDINGQIAQDMFLIFPIIRSVLLGNKDHTKKDSKLIHSKYHALGILAKNGPQPMSVIGKKIGLSKPNMTFIINSLIKEGKVIRSKSNDRRKVIIEITDKGTSDLKDAWARLKKEFDKKLDFLSEDELIVLSNSLKNIKSLVLKMNQGVDVI